MAAAAVAVATAITGRRRLAEARSAKADRTVLLLALIPTGATLVFEWTTGITPSNLIRALAGLPLGAAVAWAIGMIN